MAGELYFTGLTNTGFDAGAIVDQIMQLKSIPIQRLQQEKTQIQAKLSSLGNLSGAIGDFLSLFENLNVDDLFKGKQASVSDSNVLNVTVNESAPNIEFSVTVNKLAQAEIRVSNSGFTDLTGSFSSSGTITITYDTGSGTETFNVDYTVGQTLEDLVNAINSSQDRVKASIYFDGTTYKLMLSENSVGASTVETDITNGVYVISVSGLPTELGSGLDTIQGAQNAELVIGSGSPVTSPSNTFENVISGITLEAKNTGTATVTVTESYSKVTNFLNSFVKNFNSTVELVDQLTTGEKALFLGDSSVLGVKYGITDRLDPLINLGLINYDGNTGKISINTERLNELLQSDPESVKSAISDLKDRYQRFLEVEKGVFQSFENTYNERIERIDERIRELSQRLLYEEQMLRREYAQLEAFIAQANDIKQRLQQFIVTLSEMTKGGSNR